MTIAPAVRRTINLMAIDSALIEDVVETYIDALVLYARQFFANRSLHDAEDVVQDAFSRLSQQPRMPENVSAWLYTVVRNTAHNALRSNIRRKTHEAEYRQTLLQPDEESPIDLEKVELWLEQIDAVQREIVTLHIWSNLTFIDIAKLTQLSRTTVIRRYEEALETLKRLLSKD